MNEDQPFGFATPPSPQDDRTLGFIPTVAHQKGGVPYTPDQIYDQHRVGICTAISLTTHASRHFKQEMSPDFHYLMEKLQDGNWDEGSSILSSLKIAKNIGFLPASYFPAVEADRNQNYPAYIAELKTIVPNIERYKMLAAPYKIGAYASVPIDRNMLAQAIDESDGGVLVRFEIGNEWWIEPIEPLRKPVRPISGHATIISNYDGNSMRIANSFGVKWADKGTAYFDFSYYRPTEAWHVYFPNAVPQHVTEQLAQIPPAPTTPPQPTIADLQTQLSLLQRIIKLLLGK